MRHIPWKVFTRPVAGEEFENQWGRKSKKEKETGENGAISKRRWIHRNDGAFFSAFPPSTYVQIDEKGENSIADSICSPERVIQ